MVLGMGWDQQLLLALVKPPKTVVSSLHFHLQSTGRPPANTAWYEWAPSAPALPGTQHTGLDSPGHNLVPQGHRAPGSTHWQNPSPEQLGVMGVGLRLRGDCRWELPKKGPEAGQGEQSLLAHSRPPCCPWCFSVCDCIDWLNAE